MVLTVSIVGSRKCARDQSLGVLGALGRSLASRWESGSSRDKASFVCAAGNVESGLLKPLSTLALR